jgi:hypothetical protein
MTPRRFATLAAALCGTVFLAGWVIAEVAGLGMQGIKNTDKGITEDRRARLGAYEILIACGKVGGRKAGQPNLITHEHVEAAVAAQSDDLARPIERLDSVDLTKRRPDRGIVEDSPLPVFDCGPVG